MKVPFFYRREWLTWLLLVAITVGTSLFFLSNTPGSYIKYIVLLLGGAKLLLVAFQFIQLRHAHAFWKLALLGFVTLFIALLIVRF